MTKPLSPNTPDPEWLAHRYDPEHDSFHFVTVDRATRRKIPFLTDEYLPPANPVVIRRQDVVAAPAPWRINYIFHSAYCCSTLLANAYDRPGKTFSLKEPVLLNDLVGWRHRGGQPEQVGAVLGDALAVMERPFTAGEVCVVKPSNVVNGLAMAMTALRPDAGVLLIHAPLETYIGSIASKGLWGRRWVRDLLLKLLTEQMVDLGFEQQDYFLQTDLQVAAVGWLAQHAMFAQMATRWPDRVRTIDSETLLARPAEALRALDHLFGVHDNDASRSHVLTQIFSRHAKSGDAFGATERKADQRDATIAHGDEIGKVVEWTAAVAAAAGVSLALPTPLLPNDR